MGPKYSIHAPHQHRKGSGALSIQIKCDVPIDSGGYLYLFSGDGIELQSYRVPEENGGVWRTYTFDDSKLRSGSSYVIKWYDDHRLNMLAAKLKESDPIFVTTTIKIKPTLAPVPLPASVRTHDEISSAERKYFASAFESMDKDRNGKVNYYELKNYLIKFGFRVTDQDIKDMMKCADTNSDGSVDFKEFVRVVKSAEVSHAHRGWIAMKRSVDREVAKHPKPSKSGLKRTLTSSEPVMTVAENKVFSEIFSEMDSNNDGHISYFELKNKMSYWGFDFSDGTIRNMMREADVDGNGEISFHEFVNVCRTASSYFSPSHWKGPYRRIANRIQEVDRRRR